jgi:putative Ca2+/H+ antiporter (TMEM165/GDT1 family)
VLGTVFISAGRVALAEIGDKTMLLAVILAARFQKSWPVIWGILAATLANHALAAALGVFAGGFLQGPWVRWVLGAAFLGFAAWTLIPDKYEETKETKASGGVFLTTLVAFFLVEMGDKTQLATIALGTRFGSVFAVAAGTTLGMMLVNVPAVFIGQAAAGRLPLKAIRIMAATAFALLGLYVLAAG